MLGVKLRNCENITTWRWRRRGRSVLGRFPAGPEQRSSRPGQDFEVSLLWGNIFRQKISRDVDPILEESHRPWDSPGYLKTTQESSISPDVGPIQGGSQTHWECWPQQLPRVGGSPTAEELLLLMFGQLYIFCCWFCGHHFQGAITKTKRSPGQGCTPGALFCCNSLHGFLFQAIAIICITKTEHSPGQGCTPGA